MGLVTGLLGVGGKGGDFKAQQANINWGTNPQQLNAQYAQTQQGQQQQQDFINALQAQNGIGNQAMVFQQQQALANQLQQNALGLGPNPAQAALAQATGANTAAQAALMAGQRGASANPALIARQAAMQGAANQQAAIGQSATLQAQQQLAAQQQLGAQQQAMAGLASTQVGQQQGALQQYNQNALGGQQLLLGANAAQNTANVQNAAQANNANATIAAGAQQQGGGLIGSAAQGLVKGIGSAIGLSTGGPVPGHAPMPGDSPANDTQPAMLSPGEIVIPRSVMSSANPAEAAKAFVESVLAKGGAPAPRPTAPPAPGMQHFADGGLVAPLLEAPLPGQPGNVTMDPAVSIMPEVTAPQPMQVGQSAPGPLAAAMEADKLAKDQARASETKQLELVPGMAESQQAVKTQEAATAQQGQAEARAYTDAMQVQQRAMQAAESRVNELRNQFQDTASRIADGQINPNHYMENMGTGGKIKTAIGMIIAGLGSGTGDNPVMSYLNRQIDRDIEAQRANLGKEQTLLGSLQQQYGNEVAATSAFQAIRREALANQIAQAAAQAKTPQAKAAAEAAVGKLKQEAIPYLMRVAALSNGGDPAAKIRFLVPEEKQQAVANEIARAENTAHAEKDIIAAFDRAAAGRGSVDTAMRLGKESPALAELRNLLLPTIAEQVGGKPSEQEVAKAAGFEPHWKHTDAEIKDMRAGLIRVLHQHKSAPLAKTYGIDVSQYQSTAPGMNMQTKSGANVPDAWVQWANANPNNPMAQALKAKLAR